MPRTITFLLLVSLTALAQELPSARAIAKLTPDQVQARDKFEDDIAQAIVEARQAVGLETIQRIHDDKKLRRLTCTFAAKDDSLGFGKDGFGLPSVQLVTTVKEFSTTYRDWLRSHGSKEWNAGPKIERFAVAAWPARERKKYWIVFEYHPSAAAEWASKALNDSKNGWKRLLVEPCKKVD